MNELTSVYWDGSKVAGIDKNGSPGIHVGNLTTGIPQIINAGDHAILIYEHMKFRFDFKTWAIQQI